MRSRRRRGGSWVAAFEDVRERFELEVGVTLDRAPHPARIDRIADVLAALWPGFLAPAGVSLVVVGGDRWDAESMALRSYRLRSAS